MKDKDDNEIVNKGPAQMFGDNPENQDEKLNFGGEQKSKDENLEVKNENKNLFETPEQKTAREASEKANAGKKPKVDDKGQPLKNDKGEVIYEEPEKKVKVNDKGQPLKDEKGNVIYEEPEQQKNIFSLDDNQKRDLGYIPIDEIATKLGIDLGENKSVDAFVEKYTAAIEEAKQKIELDKSKYEEPIRNVFDFVEKGGNAMDLIDITQPFNDFIILSPEDKIRQIVQNDPEKPLSLIQANEYIDKLKTEGKFEDIVAGFTQKAVSLRQNAVNQVIKDGKTLHQKSIDAEKLSLKKENDNMVKNILEKKDFLGYPLPEETRRYVAKQIELGTFHKELNTAEAQIDAYLFRRFGKVLISQIQEDAKKGNNEAFNKGVDKINEVLHQKADIEQGGGGHSIAPRDQQGPFTNWSENKELKT
jgi:hypothetical protein